MLKHIKTYRAGESGYYDERERGTVDVWHDSKRYVYAKPYQGIKAFKCELLYAFGIASRCNAKITGSYPSYTIDTWC